MGRPAKNTELHILEGTFRPDRHADPKDMPALPPADPAEIPESLKAKGREVWQRTAPKLVDLGLLTELDRTAFECYCSTFDEVQEMDELLKTEGMVYHTNNGTPKAHPALRIRKMAHDRQMAYAKSFGLLPTARVNLIGKTATKKPPQVSRRKRS